MMRARTLLIGVALSVMAARATAQHHEEPHTGAAKAPHAPVEAFAGAAAKASAGHTPEAPPRQESARVPVLGQVMPAKPEVKPAGAKPTRTPEAVAVEKGHVAERDQPAEKARAAERGKLAEHGHAEEKGTAESPAPGRDAAARRKAEPSRSNPVDVAASINQRLAELAELRKTVPAAFTRTAPPVKREGAVKPPEAARPPETARPRVELQWRVPVTWPEDLGVTGHS